MILPAIELQPGVQVAVTQATAQTIVAQTTVTQTGDKGTSAAADGAEASFSAAFGKSLRESATAFEAGAGRAAGAEAERSEGAKAAGGGTGSRPATRTGDSLVAAARGAEDGGTGEVGKDLAKTAADSSAIGLEGRFEGRSDLRFAGGAKTPGTAAEDLAVKAAETNGATKTGGGSGDGVAAKSAGPGGAGTTAEVNAAGPPNVAARAAGLSSGNLGRNVEAEASAAAEHAVGALQAGGHNTAEAGVELAQVNLATAKQAVNAGPAVEEVKTALKAQTAKGPAGTATVADLSGQTSGQINGRTSGKSGQTGAVKSGDAGAAAELQAARSAGAGQFAAASVAAESTGGTLRNAGDTGSLAGSEATSARSSAAGLPAQFVDAGAATKDAADSGTGAVAIKTARGSAVDEASTVKAVTAKTTTTKATTAKTGAKLEGGGGASSATANAATAQGAVHGGTDITRVAVALSTAGVALPATALANPVVGHAGTNGRSGAQAASKGTARTVQATGAAAEVAVAADVAAQGKAALGPETAIAAGRQAGEAQGPRERGPLQQAQSVAAEGQDVSKLDALKLGASQPDLRADPSASAGTDSSAAVVVPTVGLHAASVAASVPAAAVNVASGAATGGIAGVHTVGAAQELAGGVSGPRGVSSTLSSGGLAGGAGSAARTEGAAIVEPHRTLAATPTTLEVGVPNGTEGWLRIRAQVGDQGQVNASLAAGSSAGQEMLHRELPALNAYLHGEQLAVTAAVTERSFATAGGGVADDPGRAMANANSGQASPGQASSGQAGTAQGDAAGSGQRSDRAVSVGLDAGDALRGYNGAGSSAGVTQTWLDGESGRWLNVQA